MGDDAQGARTGGVLVVAPATALGAVGAGGSGRGCRPCVASFVTVTGRRSTITQRCNRRQLMSNVTGEIGAALPVRGHPLASIVLGIRAGYLNIHGRPQFGTSVALGIAILVLFSDFLARPGARRPPVTVTYARTQSRPVYARDRSRIQYTHDGDGNLYRFTESWPTTDAAGTAARRGGGTGRPVRLWSSSGWSARRWPAMSYFVAEEVRYAGCRPHPAAVCRRRAGLTLTRRVADSYPDSASTGRPTGAGAWSASCST